MDEDDMEPNQWIAGFRHLHERARKGELHPTERETYLLMREELARSLVAAQGMSLPEGQNARRHFRVAQVFALEVNHMYKSVTKDVSRSGFSALVTANFKEGERIAFSMVLSRGQEPVTGEAEVVAALRQAGNSRVSCTITHISPDNAERLELALYDAVLGRIK